MPGDWLGERLQNDLFCVEWDVKPQLNRSIPSLHWWVVYALLVARYSYLAGQHDSSTPAVVQLHWLLAHHCLTSKFTILTFNVLQRPVCLCETVQRYILHTEISDHPTVTCLWSTVPALWINQSIKIYFPSNNRKLQCNKCCSTWRATRKALRSFRLVAW